MDPSTVVVLGGPAAGKTVFLTALYHHLWRGTGDLRIRAATGQVHTDLLTAAEQILLGKMPPATQALRHMEFELDHRGRVYYLRFLDYPGELFRRVFYDSIVDSDEAKLLYEASTGADGVIALADPTSVLDGTWDIDYALSNLIRFYRSNGKKQPKFVLAFTKRDQTELLVGLRIKKFVKDNLPHLASELGNGIRLQHFCSVIAQNGQVSFSQPDTVVAPLRSIIQALEEERYVTGRRLFMRKLAWQRSLIRAFAIIFAILMVFLAFASGVVCRSKSKNESTQVAQ